MIGLKGGKEAGLGAKEKKKREKKERR